MFSSVNELFKGRFEGFRDVYYFFFGFEETKMEIFVVTEGDIKDLRKKKNLTKIYNWRVIAFKILQIWNHFSSSKCKQQRERERGRDEKEWNKFGATNNNEKMWMEEKEHSQTFCLVIICFICLDIFCTLCMRRVYKNSSFSWIFSLPSSQPAAEMLLMKTKRSNCMHATF